MRAIAINGSPRKDWNTATLLRKALEGAESEGAETRLVHLYDLSFKGCTSCFSCKMKYNTCGGLCAMKDDLRDTLKETLESDVLLLGSPIYYFACDAIFQRHAAMLRILNGDSEILAAYDTYQFPDYSKVRAPMFDETRKARVRAERFPIDCQGAYGMGARLAASRK